jgi:lycopene cyclase-like protein
MKDDTHDIAVLGSGPAALAIAAACARRGATVALIAPEPESAWQPNYCLWADELPPGMEGLIEHRWPEASVVTPSGSHLLSRSYAKLDTMGLQAFFWGPLRAAPARIIADRATRLDRRGSETWIQMDGGSTERARVVIDASGGGTPFVERAHRRAPAFQKAFGLMLWAPGHGFDPQRMVLMDFRAASADTGEPPSFLYVLPLGDDRLFVEETSLARRPAMSFDLLRQRLEVRLQTLGLAACERIGEEHCVIPMGLGLPVRGQPLVPFGAAAAMVHPASGYLISHVLRKADPVAASIVEGLASGDPELATTAGNATLWPRAERALWEIYAFGLESLVGMSAIETGRFFDSFFQLPEQGWADFLAGTSSPSEVGSVMLRLFRNLPASVRWRLVRTSLSAGAAPLARSVLQPGAS